MSTWSPLWSQVVDSTLWEEDLEVRVLFLTMLAIKEPDHVVRMPFRRLCKKANMPPEKVRRALDILLNPDLRSGDEQPEEGRRLREVEGGWYVINGEYYRREMARLMERTRKTNWQRQKRAQEKLARNGKALPGESSAVGAMGRGDERGADAIAAERVPSGRGRERKEERGLLEAAEKLVENLDQQIAALPKPEAEGQRGPGG